MFEYEEIIKKTLIRNRLLWKRLPKIPLPTISIGDRPRPLLIKDSKMKCFQNLKKCWNLSRNRCSTALRLFLKYLLHKILFHTISVIWLLQCTLYFVSNYLRVDHKPQKSITFYTVDQFINILKKKAFIFKEGMEKLWEIAWSLLLLERKWSCQNKYSDFVLLIVVFLLESKYSQISIADIRGSTKSTWRTSSRLSKTKSTSSKGSAGTPNWFRASALSRQNSHARCRPTPRHASDWIITSSRSLPRLWRQSRGCW